MKLKALFEDDGAVSPVIGVILMVAITVILAAVIGTFVLGLGDRVSEASPNAQFSFEYTDGPSTEEDIITITHDGGDGVETSQIKVLAAGTNIWENGDTSAAVDVSTGDNQWTDKEKITAGDKQSLEEDNSGTDVFGDGDAVKVVWTASGSDKTAVIGESEVSL